MTPTIGQTFATLNSVFAKRLQEACNNSPIPTEEEAQALMPEIPPECWNTAPVDPKKAWEAVVAMCGGR